MFVYILKRLALIVPTLLGVLLLTFVVVQFVPGGPVEQYLAEAKAGKGAGAEGGFSYRGSQGVDPKRIEQAKAEWTAGHFGKVPGDEIEFIPLPEKPGVNSVGDTPPL